MLAKKIFSQADANYYLTRAETQRLRLGDQSACQSLGTLADNSEHKEVALLAIVALQQCGSRRDDLPFLLQEAKRLELFEPELALTALLDPQAAQNLAYSRGWHAQDILTPLPRQ